jgi:hypothetical protein
MRNLISFSCSRTFRPTAVHVRPLFDRAAVLLALILLVAPRPSARGADVPGLITYQGRITSHGTNFSGLGKFKFSLVTPGFLAATVWSHDGQTPPKSALSIPVTDGLFTVALGDTSIPGMTQALAPDLFDQANLRLRIWFDDGASGQTQLSPDQP